MAVNKDFLMGYGAGKAAGGGGGDNRNWVEVVEGTMEYPWGDFNYEWIVDSIGANNMTAYISADATAIGISGNLVVPVMNNFNNRNVMAHGVMGSNVAGITMSALMIWNEYGYSDEGTISFAVINSGGVDTDLTAYASMIPTELTIIYHPLPE